MAITVTHPFVSAIADDPAAAAAGQVVPSNWNATHSLSGTLDVANGGTGVTTSTGTGSVVLSNSPTLVTPALGTPLSGVVTNLTGTASININGTVGATTPTTGAFTTISASSTSTLTGNVGIGSAPTTDALRVSGTASGSTFINGVIIDETVASGVTSAYRSVLSRPVLENSTFTLTNLYHFYANPQTKPASPTLTNQYGYHAESTLTDATNNYGFYANIAASGTSRYNFYAAGTAPNYFGGNTIVSVTDNTNAALRVTQLGTANALEIEDSTNPDATPFIVDSSGRLIQGYTTAVASKILTTVSTPNWQVHSVVPANYSWTNNATFPGFFLFNKSKSGVIGTLSAVTDGDNLGIIQFNGADNDATPTFNPAAYISAQVAGTVASTSIPGRLNFATTAEAGTSPTVRASITPEGYLGIGATPTLAQQLVDVRASNNGLTSDSANNTLRFTDTDTTTAANQPIGKIEFYNSDTGNAAVGAYILSSAVGTSGGGTIRFGAAADAGAVAEVARVASTGLTVVNAVSVGSTGATTGSLLINGSTSGTVTVSTAAAAGTWTLTLPTSAGTNGYVLSTNGAGVTSWVAQSGGGGGGATAGDNIFLANNFGGF